jgi:hypothetical protein
MSRNKTFYKNHPHPDGTSTTEYMDGSKEHYDAQGKLMSGIVVTDAQIELWKKQPKEQALKEALELFKSQGMDISEAKFKLEVLKFISELQNVREPDGIVKMPPILIQVNVPGTPFQKPVIDIEITK